MDASPSCNPLDVAIRAVSQQQQRPSPVTPGAGPLLCDAGDQVAAYSGIGGR
jgi:hypothetical protein